MPRTRRAARAAASAAGQTSFLLELPDELLSHVATLLLDDNDLTCALRLIQACKALRSRLAQIQDAALKRRMRWLPELTNGHIVVDGGRTAVCDDQLDTWTASTLLPTRGRVSWTIEMTSNDNWHNETGICNAANTCAWVIDMGNDVPRLCRITRAYKPLAADKFQWDFRAPAPAGFPTIKSVDLPELERDVVDDGRYRLERWKHRLFEFTLDADAGELWMSVHGCAATHVLSGLPAGEALRACSIIHGGEGDRAVLSPYYRVRRVQ